MNGTRDMKSICGEHPKTLGSRSVNKVSIINYNVIATLLALIEMG
jgi:hypothetical protein